MKKFCEAVKDPKIFTSKQFKKDLGYYN